MYSVTEVDFDIQRVEFFFFKLLCNDLYKFVKVSQISFANCNSEMLDNISSATTKYKLATVSPIFCSHFLSSAFFSLSPIASKQFSFLGDGFHFHFP